MTSITKEFTFQKILESFYVQTRWLIRLTLTTAFSVSWSSFMTTNGRTITRSQTASIWPVPRCALPISTPNATSILSGSPCSNPTVSRPGKKPTTIVWRIWPRNIWANGTSAASKLLITWILCGRRVQKTSRLWAMSGSTNSNRSQIFFNFSLSRSASAWFSFSNAPIRSF